MVNIPHARTGIENARNFSHTSVRQWGSEVPRTSLREDPRLHPDHFLNYLTPAIDLEPYGGSVPRIPRIRRAILAIALKHIDPKIPEARKDLMVSQHLARRQSLFERSFDMPNNTEPEIITPTSEINGDQLPQLVGDGTSKKVKEIREEVIQGFDKWKEENVKTFSEHTGAHARHEAHELREDFIDIPHKYGRKHKLLVDKQARRRQKLLVINRAIVDKKIIKRGAVRT